MKILDRVSGVVLLLIALALLSGRIFGQTIYCTGKVSSEGCAPLISWSGVSSATANSGFSVNLNQAIAGNAVLLYYSVNGRAALPFGGGILCVKPPVKIAITNNAAGSGTSCNGTSTIDMNSFAMGSLGGTPARALLVPGTVVNCQWQGIDMGYPYPNNVLLSDALEYVVGP